MKKILLILLAFISFASFAQAEFPEGIALSGNASSSNTTKVVIQEPTTGNLNYINALDLPASTADKLKGYLSTGLIKNGAITINGDPTKFNITAGIGIISNFDDPSNPVSTIVNFPAFTGITPTYLTTGNITYIAINNTPAVVMQATPFTATQRRDLIELGAVIHSNLTTINVINNLSSPTNASTNQLHDLFDIIGALNLSGNVYTANGANLQLNKSAGIIGKRGVNFINNWKDPHRLSQAGETALSFRYRTQNGTEGTDRVNLDPALYDLNNVLTAVPNNKFTIQTVVMFQTGLTRILYGQTIYDDLQSAKNAIFTRSFVIEPNSKDNGIIRSYVIMKNNTTSLQNVADASILEAQKFGGVASGGVALTLANIVTALGYTPENEANKQNSLAVDGTNTKYPTVTAVNTGLALKANLASPTFTGVPLVPTATAGTNTLQAASTAFVTGGIATADSGNVKLTGNQTITGTKTFNNSSSAQSIFVNNTSTGTGIYSSNNSTGRGLVVENSSTGEGILSANTSTGTAIIARGGLTATGFNYVGQNNNTNTFTVDKLGATTATSFINSTAPATNALLANGTTLANPISGTGTTGYLPKFTSAGFLGNSSVEEVSNSLRILTGLNSSDISYGIGKEFSSSNSTFFGWRYNAGNPYGFLSTFGNTAPFALMPDGGKVLVGTATNNGVDTLQVSGSALATQYKLSALNTAPASATATGTLGEIRITAGFIYVCTATNTWVRTALTTW